jgi:hypothetical protein
LTKTRTAEKIPNEDIDSNGEGALERNATIVVMDVTNIVLADLR